MPKVRIYLDNCCYNRPYDDQTQPKVVVETLAKLYVQELVLQGRLELAWSYILKYENSRNVGMAKREAIAKWEKLSTVFVGKSEPLVALAHEIENTGIKAFDALHIACAITAECDYFITVDRRITKYRNDRIAICTPIDFIEREAENDE